MTKRPGRRTNNTGRSEGEGRFIQFPDWVIESPAFLSLTAAEICTLLFLLKRFNGKNNGKIGFGVRSGCFVPKQGTGEVQNRPIPVSRPTIGRALETLERFGLTACTKDATFNQKRLAREWRLTWLPCDGKAATKEFARYSADDCKLIRAEKTKASLTGETVKANTVSLARQSTPLENKKVPLQSHGRDYDASTQSHGRDTSSNHRLGGITGDEIAA